MISVMMMTNFNVTVLWWWSWCCCYRCSNTFAAASWIAFSQSQVLKNRSNEETDNPLLVTLKKLLWHRPTKNSKKCQKKSQGILWMLFCEDPSRSMLLRLLAAAKAGLFSAAGEIDDRCQVRTPGGPWLVAFEDFCNAARMEPALPLGCPSKLAAEKVSQLKGSLNHWSIWVFLPQLLQWHLPVQSQPSCFSKVKATKKIRVSNQYWKSCARSAGTGSVTWGCAYSPGVCLDHHRFLAPILICQLRMASIWCVFWSWVCGRQELIWWEKRMIGKQDETGIASKYSTVYI